MLNENMLAECAVLRGDFPNRMSFAESAGRSWIIFRISAASSAAGFSDDRAGAEKSVPLRGGIQRENSMGQNRRRLASSGLTQIGFGCY